MGCGSNNFMISSGNYIFRPLLFVKNHSKSPRYFWFKIFDYLSIKDCANVMRSCKYSLLEHFILLSKILKQ